MFDLRKDLIFFSILALVSGPVTAGSNDNVGIEFDNRISVDGVTIDLVGTGLLKFLGFKAYAGAFYLETGVDSRMALSDRAKRIELEYFRPIDGEDFGPATEKSILKNVDMETFNRLKDRIMYHNSLYEDVKPGDRYSLTYVPGRGTELALNGEPKGVIRGADFAAAIFSIWVGDNPISKSFKSDILGLS